MCNKLNRIIKMKVRHVFKHFNVKIKISSLEIIMNKFDNILKDITYKIKNNKGDTINYNIVKKIIYKSNIMKKWYNKVIMMDFKFKKIKKLVNIKLFNLLLILYNKIYKNNYNKIKK